jgi:hypothetical protein
MLERLTDPIFAASVLTSALLAICFLQSGLDKVLDFKGNLAWLNGHFAKSPLRGQVAPMLVVVTILECAAGALCAVGVVQIILSSDMKLALLGAELAALNIVMLFFGQRVAKDYAGAAALVPYFIVCVGAIVLLGR